MIQKTDDDGIAQNSNNRAREKLDSFQKYPHKMTQVLYDSL